MSVDRQALHHYTSGDGLLGIFATQQVWATQIQYLNDAREFAHAISEARAVLWERAQRIPDSVESQLCQALWESFDRISGLNVFVACFSAIEDSLSQWRGYCPPGFGYSIGFYADELRRVAAPQGFELVECIYDPIRQRQLADTWAVESLAALRATLPGDASLKTHVEKSGHLYFPGFVRFAPALKDPAFRNEHEWRLVALLTDQREVKLRPGKSMLLPYVPIELGLRSNDQLVSSIRVGPTPNMQLAISAATNLFRHVRIGNGVGGSHIPFRAW